METIGAANNVADAGRDFVIAGEGRLGKIVKERRPLGGRCCGRDVA
jgi:hypothetical protein